MIDIALEVGAVNETVAITAEATLIEEISADCGYVAENRHSVELSLNSRNPFMLGVLTPGVNFNGALIWQRPFHNGAIAQWTINGSQQNDNEFLLDGAPNNLIRAATTLPMCHRWMLCASSISSLTATVRSTVASRAAWSTNSRCRLTGI